MLFRKRPKTLDYDRERLRPVLRASICTEADLEEFLKTYGLSRDEVPTEY